MNKKIIKLNESELRKKISEAVSEMLRTRRNGLPDPVFSTDNPNTSWAKIIKKDEDDENIQNAYFGWGPIRNDMSNLINARSRGEDAQLPRLKDYSIGNWDKAVEDEFADEIADNKRYYENPEGTENIWYDQEEPEPVEVRENVVKLKEAQLKKIVAESVNKVLKEMAKQASYYVDDGEEFFDFNEAYDHAYEIAKKSKEIDGEDMEDVLLMDNIEWKPLVKFTYDGIYNLVNGTFLPW